MAESSIELLTIDALAYGGEAVGTLPGGKRCFVRGGVPGDTLKVRISSEKKNFARAEILGIVKPSPDRIQPECPFFGKCPGCSYQNTSYAVELRWKQAQFERFLIHQHLAEPEALGEPVPAPSRFGWRNKVRFTVKDGVRGYIAADNVSHVPVTDCMLAQAPIRCWLKKNPAPLPETEQETLRCDSLGNVHNVTEENKAELLHEILYGIAAMDVPAGSFFQVDLAAFSILAQEFRKILEADKPELFADLYCGSGTFSMIAAAAGVPEILGVELDSPAVAAADANLKKNPAVHAQFMQGDAALLFKHLRIRRNSNVMLLVDPPRTGLARNLAEALGKARGVRRLVYVSCAPDTLARDLAILEKGPAAWHVVSSRLFDMFPATAHFESMTLLERGERGERGEA